MEKRETTVIGTINGTDICAITDNGEVFVPIKPICTAIGVNYTTQIDKISEDPILSSVPLGGDSCRRQQGTRNAMFAVDVCLWMAVYH